METTKTTKRRTPPKCPFCHQSPFKTPCKAFSAHLELCALKVKQSSVVQPIVNVNYYDNRTINNVVNIAIISERIQSVHDELKSLPYDRLNDEDKLNFIVDKALEYVPEFSIAFDNKNDPLHEESKKYVVGCLDIVRETVRRHGDGLLVEDITESIVDIESK